MQPERWLGAITIVLRRALNVLLIDFEDHLTHLEHALQHRVNFTQFSARIIVAQSIARDFFSLGFIDQQIQVIQAARSHGCKHRIRGHAVLDIAELEHLLHAAQHITQVVDIRAISQHVRDFEDLSRLCVGVARHDHAKALSAHVMRLGLALPHAFNAASTVRQRNEFLQKLGVRVLYVVDIQHHVIGHLQRQVELFQLFGSRSIRRLRRIQ